MAVKPLDNEIDILAKIAQGDERSFAELFYWYAKPLSQFVFKLTDSLELSEEIIQDTFIKIWLRRETLPEIQNFGGYLYTICRNETFLVLKKIASKNNAHTVFEKEIIQDLELQELDNPADEYRKRIELAVEKLPEQQKKVYKMSRHDKLKHQEIALALNISSETVKKHIQYAVHFIKNDVKGNAVIILVLTSPIFFS